MNETELAKLNNILLAYFVGGKRLVVNSCASPILLVAATVRVQTKSFSAGQILYIYDVYWGENERALTVGRFRRKHRFICGNCPVRNLTGFRPVQVFDPRIIQKVALVNPGIFLRFFDLPGGHDTITHYIESLRASEHSEPVVD